MPGKGQRSGQDEEQDEDQLQEQGVEKPQASGVLANLGWAIGQVWNSLPSFGGKGAPPKAEPELGADKGPEEGVEEGVEEALEDDLEEGVEDETPALTIHVEGSAKKKKKKKKKGKGGGEALEVEREEPEPAPKAKPKRPKMVVDNADYNDKQIRPLIAKAIEALELPQNAEHIDTIQKKIDEVTERADKGLELMTIPEQVKLYGKLLGDAQALAKQAKQGWTWTAFTPVKKSPLSWLTSWGMTSGGKTVILDVGAAAGKPAHATVNQDDLGDKDVAETAQTLQTLFSEHHITLENTGRRNDPQNPHVYYSGKTFSKWRIGADVQPGRHDPAADLGTTFFLATIRTKAKESLDAAAEKQRQNESERADR